MQEKVNELYEYYLEKKLNQIFDGNTEAAITSPLVDVSYRGSAYDYHFGYRKDVNGLKMVNYRNFKEELLLDEWYDDGEDFYYGYAIVRKYFKELGCVKENIIDTSGRLVSDKWFDKIIYHNVYNNAVITGLNFKKNAKGKYDGTEHIFLDNGDDEIADRDVELSKTLVKRDIPISVRDYKKVEIDGKYNYKKFDRTLLLKENVDSIGPFEDGYALVCNNGKYNLVDVYGNYVSKELWFDEIKSLKSYYDDELQLKTVGYVRVYNDDKFNYMDMHGNLLFDWMKTTRIINSWNDSSVDNINRFIDFKGYELTKPHELSNGTKTYKLRATPIRMYDDYILCCRHVGFSVDYANFEFYLYDKSSGKYFSLGKSDRTRHKFGNGIGDYFSQCLCFDDNFIYDYFKEKVYLIYGKQIVDVTNYYKKHLKGKRLVSVNKNLSKIQSIDEFHYDNIEDINKAFQEEEAKKREEEKRETERIENIRISERLKELQLDEARRKQAASDLVDEIETDLDAVDVKLQLLEELEKNGVVPRVNCKTAYLFKEVVDANGERHLEFRDLVTKNGRLHLFNLSQEKFVNVKMDHGNYENCILNNIEPTKVYKRNLSFCNFKNVHFDPMTRWTNVNICGSTFSDDKDHNTPNIMPAFEDAIFDDKTTYNGIPLTSLIKKNEEGKTEEIESSIIEPEQPKTARV